ncbi:DUF637 domain-containing protein [Martelella sp.]|uniref:DUF637 domain-containing protein n=2 Tax=unclassified Martelella TaxID=2629616 RepID=UPI0025C00E65|nr:DUF637 domain-containing protein [Martelella sp.]
MESLDGMVSGYYDLGDILAGATFSAVTAGLTEGIGLEALGITDKTHPDLCDGIINGFGKGNLSLANIIDGALDGMITSGLSSAVYGTDFGSSFSRSLLNTVVSLTLADVQFEIGKLGLEEGSFPHAMLHGLAGCAAAEATGVSCAAGAAGAIAQSLYAGTTDEFGRHLNAEEYTNTAEFIGAFAGFLLSSGNAENVNVAALVAESGFENNALCGG